MARAVVGPAAWLLAGLHRRGSWRPQPGWGVFLLQVFAASALLAVFLMWAAGAFAWTAMPDAKLVRIGLVTVMVTAAVALYFGAAWAAGLRFRALLRRWRPVCPAALDGRNGLNYKHPWV